MTTKKRIYLIAAALSVLLAITLLTASAGDTETVWEGNPNCSDIGYGQYFEYKLEPVESGTFGDGMLEVTIVVNNDKTFDFTSNFDIHAIIVKGGPDANVYTYDPVVKSGEGLHAPEQSEGKYYGLSHISFCYEIRPEVTVTKNAIPTFTRTWNWDIVKSVTPGSWDLFVGDSGTSEYTVAVTKTGYTDSEWAVSGTIKVENTGLVDATVVNVTDVISGPINPSLTCPGFPITLLPGDYFTCSYSSSLPNGDSRTNTATATLDNGDSFSREVGFSFDTPTTVVNDTINVTDFFEGVTTELGSFSGTGSVSYTRTFFCGEDEGTHNNTATIVETGQSDDASVTVNCYALDVLKDAVPTFTRTWNWDIVKSVTPGSWDLFVGDSGTSEYTVAVTKTGYTDSEWAVSGVITINNPAPMDATLTDVSDMISGYGSVDVTCPAELVVPAGGSLECTYGASLPDGSDRTNTATATQQNYAYAPDGTATAAGTTDYSWSVGFSFDTPTTVVNDTINVTDFFEGVTTELGSFSGTGSVSYTRTFFCGEDEGTHNNTATIVETGQSDDASVTVNCYDLTVTKDAKPTFTRTYEWDITKTSEVISLTLGVGESVMVPYMVTATATGYNDTNFAVSGTITIFNPAPMAAELTAVTDLISPDIAADVTCPAGLTVPAAVGGVPGELECTYSASLLDAETRTNTATATLQNYDYASDGTSTASGTTDFDSPEVSVDFTNAIINHIDECIVVTDDQFGSLGEVCVNFEGDFPQYFYFSYEIQVGPYYDCEEKIFENIASFVTNDNGETGSDNHIIEILMICGNTYPTGKEPCEFAIDPDGAFGSEPPLTLLYKTKDGTFNGIIKTVEPGNFFYYSTVDNGDGTPKSVSIMQSNNFDGPPMFFGGIDIFTYQVDTIGACTASNVASFDSPDFNFTFEVGVEYIIRVRFKPDPLRGYDLPDIAPTGGYRYDFETWVGGSFVDADANGTLLEHIQ